MAYINEKNISYEVDNNKLKRNLKKNPYKYNEEYALDFYKSGDIPNKYILENIYDEYSIKQMKIKINENDPRYANIYYNNIHIAKSYIDVCSNNDERKIELILL